MDAQQRNALTATLLELASAHALDGIKSSRWFRTAPAKHRLEEPPVRFTGIEHHKVYTSQGGVGSGAYDAPFLCGVTEVGGISATFRLRLDIGRGGFVIEEQ